MRNKQIIIKQSCILLLISLFSLFCPQAFSQERHGKPHEHKFQPKEFVKDMEAFIVCEANLTPEEATAFFPLFHQLKRGQRELQKQIVKLSKSIENQNLSEQQCEEILEKITQCHVKLEELQVNALSEWRKLLPASKVLKVILADHKFGKKVYREMMQKRKNRSYPRK